MSIQIEHPDWAAERASTSSPSKPRRSGSARAQVRLGPGFGGGGLARGGDQAAA
jgi:hypothetical protein